LATRRTSDYQSGLPDSARIPERVTGETSQMSVPVTLNAPTVRAKIRRIEESKKTPLRCVAAQSRGTTEAD
jgi:hypothetical protein